VTHPEAEASALDLIVVGAGPTGIAIGAEARMADLEALVVDRGGVAASIQRYPTDLVYFSTRERLEIGGVPFAIPEAKPSRRQALVYYREVAKRHSLPLALFEEVTRVARRDDGLLEVRSWQHGAERLRAARAVAVATGYFDTPRRLGVVGEEASWVRQRYLEPYEHFDQNVVIVGAGSSATEAALELCRNGVRVSLVHRGREPKPTLKYWLKPDLENRLAEGAIRGLFETRVVAFEAPADGASGAVVVEGPGGRERLTAQTAYVLIGYRPDVSLLVGAGVTVDPATLVPSFDGASCESNVPGLYVAGTLQAGRATDKIFIENSREHAPKIVRHLVARRNAEKSSSR
jgi:thioredoxin reductase (NADPH)